MSIQSTPNTAIRAVLWDFGGVFTTSPFAAFTTYEAAKGLPKDLSAASTRGIPTAMPGP
jgi:putative hydrolase of the HAD superfamily